MTKVSPANAAHLSSDLKWVQIGSRFQLGNRVFMVTDIGTRTLVAVAVGEKEVADPTWLSGPPYAVAEVVIDEDDFGMIEPTTG